MYAGEDGEVCVELGYAGKSISSSKAKQPDKSKVGGSPAWYGEAPVDVADLACQLCGRCLYLITQVYAPTHVHRSLCIFCCNQAACSVRPEGWRVVRTQAPRPPPPPLPPLPDREQPPDPSRHEESDPATAAAVYNSNSSSGKGAAVGGRGSTQPPPAPPFPVAASEESVPNPWGAEGDVSWDTAAADGDGWGAESSEWGQGGDARGPAGEATADIHALLDEQEKRLSKIHGYRAAAGPASRRRGGGACDQIALAGLPLPPDGGRGDRQLGAAEYPGRDLVSPTVTKCTAVAAGSAGGEGRPSFPPKTLSFAPEPWGDASSGADDKDMQNRLRRYRDQEEDRSLVAALDQALGAKDQGLRDGGAGIASIGEKYERTPARAKAVMRFAERVGRSPQQVVRYAYGGRPLWSASDPPEEDVPPCACGTPRLFEMQLMPALLLQLRVNDPTDREKPEPEEKPSASNSNGAALLPAAAAAVKRHPNSTSPSPAADNANGAASTPPDTSNGEDPEGVAREGWGGNLMGEVAPESADGDAEEAGEAAAVGMPVPSAEDRERLRTSGMDWGVVGVWSCPNSCESSREECVVVQLPV